MQFLCGVLNKGLAEDKKEGDHDVALTYIYLSVCRINSG